MIEHEVVIQMRVLVRGLGIIALGQLASSVALLSFIIAPVWAQSANSIDEKRNAALAFEQGQLAQERGDLNLAIRHYTAAIKSDATLFQAYYQRATAMIALRREGEAEADLRRVIELDETFARGHRALGQLLLDRGMTEDAKRELGRAIELDPSLGGVRSFYASALIKLGEPQRAIEHLQVAITRGEDLPLCHALVGVAYERTGKTAEALAAYSRSIELDPANATAREGRARILEQRGEMAKAIEDYTAAYRAQPSPDLAFRLAQVHARAGQPQAAIQIYRRLLLERPGDLAVRAEMARALSENGQAEEAAREIEKIVASQPGDPKLLMIAGDFYFKDKPEAAVSFYRRAAEANPGDIRARAQLGAALARSMQYQEAVSVLKDVIAREPENFAARASLATALFKLKLYVDAAREFVWLINARPDIAASYYFLANSFEHLGDCQRALKSYQEFLRRSDPAANKAEVDEATLRVSQLNRLLKERKCKTAGKSKQK